MNLMMMFGMFVSVGSHMFTALNALLMLQLLSNVVEAFRIPGDFCDLVADVVQSSVCSCCFCLKEYRL